MNGSASGIATSCHRDANPPQVSVIIAAYNRSHLLRYALRSVIAQSFSDFEVIVIGDRCTDDSAQVVSEFADERLSFYNMSLNFGDQSGPNNVGLARARGRYIAFLNQDDMWLPDHLETCLEWLQSTCSDLVHSIAARVTAPAGTSRFENWVAGSNPGRPVFDPTRDFAACSTWLARRETFERAGGFRPSWEIVTEPSQELLFRIWKMGMINRQVPNLSVIVIPSGERPGSYISTDASEHEAVFKVLSQPDFRSAILSRTGHSGNDRLSVASDTMTSLLIRPLAWLGIAPRAARLAIAGRFGRGKTIRHLRNIRGLQGVWHVGDRLSALKSREADLLASDTIGRTLSFAVGSKDALYLTSGWSHPEPKGTWTNGPVAQIVLPITAIAKEYTLEIAARAFTTARAQAQRMVVSIDDRRIGEYSLSGDQTWRCVFQNDDLDRTSMTITLDLPDAMSPKANGISADERRLGLFVKTLRVTESSSESLSYEENPRDQTG